MKNRNIHVINLTGKLCSFSFLCFLFCVTSKIHHLLNPFISVASSFSSELHQYYFMCSLGNIILKHITVAAFSSMLILSSFIIPISLGKTYCNKLKYDSQFCNKVETL
jgi:hypothetical protein